MKRFVSGSAMAAILASCANQPSASLRVVEQSSDRAWDDSSQSLSGVSSSLWSTAPNALLSMRRAKEVGDLLTVIVEVDDEASLRNSLSRSRGSNEELNINALLGIPQWIQPALPNGASLAPGVDFGRSSDLQGSGAVNRAEKITFTLAARVVGVELNGNLVIEGYQSTQVNEEIRYLTVSGVIRAQDITRDNTVTYEKIADAQLSYVGQGVATDPVDRKAVPRILDWLLPF